MDQKKVRIGDAYHQRTKYRREEMEERGLDWARKPDTYEEFPPSLKRVPIPSINRQDGKPLWETLAERRSLREFSRQPIRLEELSRLIWATQGITAKAWGFDFRIVPSAGALYPIETYLVVNRVEGISGGIYHYSVKAGQLVLIREGQFGEELSHAALGQGMLA